MPFPLPVPELEPSTPEFETVPLIKPTGFREYDGRWWFGRPGLDRKPEINLMGIQALGMGLGTLIRELGAGPRIVTGHDYRAYSASVKNALTCGLMAAGAEVVDIGLSLSPMAYHAQFALDAPSVAMVTASHNPNGWTGVKMGCDRPVTFGPGEIARLREIVLGGHWQLCGGGSYEFVEGFRSEYISSLAQRAPLSRKIRAVVACGNGTAGAFAPEVLSRLGVDVIEMDTRLDHSFPNHNPDPEDMRMLTAMAERVRETGADIAFGFDGDGDRCGVVDNEGNEIFADIAGLLLARDIAATHPASHFVADIKSTGLFATDPVLAQLGATVEYYRTGHSHMKRRIRETGAIAGFEKSGHFYLNHPVGHGYDDGIGAAIAICGLLERNPQKSMAEIRATVAATHALPTMGVHCSDEKKYEAAGRVVDRFLAMQEAGEHFAGQEISDCITVNGIRVVTEDGSWGLVRPSSNEPKLVVAIESPVSATRRDEMFAAMDGLLRDVLGKVEYT